MAALLVALPPALPGFRLLKAIAASSSAFGGERPSAAAFATAEKAAPRSGCSLEPTPSLPLPGGHCTRLHTRRAPLHPALPPLPAAAAGGVVGGAPSLAATGGAAGGVSRGVTAHLGAGLRGGSIEGVEGVEGAADPEGLVAEAALAGAAEGALRSAARAAEKSTPPSTLHKETPTFGGRAAASEDE